MQSLRRFCGRSCDCGTGAVWPRAKNARGVSCEGWWKRNGNACHGQKQAGGAAVEMWSLLMFAGPRSQNEWQACTDNGRCDKVPGRGRGRLGRPCFPNWSIIASRTWRSPSHATVSRQRPPPSPSRLLRLCQLTQLSRENHCLAHSHKIIGSKYGHPCQCERHFQH